MKTGSSVDKKEYDTGYKHGMENGLSGVNESFDWYCGFYDGKRKYLGQTIGEK